jgi:hypothetical protein
LAEFGSLTLDVVYVLQHYKDMWENNQWVEKFEIEPCHEKHRYRLLEKDYLNNCVPLNCLCGLVVIVPGYRFRGPGFDSRRYQIF